MVGCCGVLAVVWRDVIRKINLRRTENKLVVNLQGSNVLLGGMPAH